MRGDYHRQISNGQKLYVYVHTSMFISGVAVILSNVTVIHNISLIIIKIFLKLSKLY